jgi:hypothetical protein
MLLIDFKGTANFQYQTDLALASMIRVGASKNNIHLDCFALDKE